MKKIPPHINKAFVFILIFLFIFNTFSAVSIGAENTETKVVRVGWYESPFNHKDKFGRRSGYAYDYQQEVAAYTGWTYEYVEDEWPTLMQMLIDGEIDIMSDISYTEERAEKMLYSSIPMGEEEYYIFKSPADKTISNDDYSKLNGKSIGVTKGSYQLSLYLDWSNKNNIKSNIVELSCTDNEAFDMLNRGEIDLYLTIDSYSGAVDKAVPICVIGSSSFYFAVNLKRPDLLSELNNALNHIHGSNKYFNQQLYTKYINTSSTNLFLDAKESDWLSDHGTIRIAYKDNYMAYCGKDEKTGELTGALKDYLEYASVCFENAALDFEPIAYDSFDKALSDLKSGVIDCIFPVCFTKYDGETLGVLTTQPLMQTDISAVVKNSDQKGLTEKSDITVALVKGDLNFEMFLLDHYPDWEIKFFKNTEDCLKSVSNGSTDCFLVSDYRYNIDKLCEKYGLATITADVEMDYCLAVSRSDSALYSILNKITNIVPATAVNASLSHYFTEGSKMSVADFIKQYAVVFMVVIAGVLLIIILLVWKNVRSERKAMEEQKLISATETDELTGVYNKSFFDEYIIRINKENPDTPMDMVVLDIDQFHSVNAIYGRAFGDHVLHALGDEILSFLEGTPGIASRFDGDMFAIYCPQMQDSHILFNRLNDRVDAMSANISIRLRMGVKPWSKDADPIVSFEQAHIACSLARRNYKEHLVIFDDEVRKREDFVQRLQNDLKQALKNNEFEVHYQPKFDIQSDRPVLTSVEALVRWRHHELGMIRPDEFIPLFEKNGQIDVLDRFVWSQSAKQIAQWRDKYGVLISVSVNLSRVDVFDPTLEKTFDDLLLKYGLPNSAIKLEITESAYTESSDQVIPIIEQLREKGHEIEMDDFGSGYSSLNMLSSMPMDYLKMDKAFVRNIEHNEKDIQMIKLILGIAKNLKIPVVAEGVETEKQLMLLKELGCEIVQGYYFSKPLPSDEFEKKYFIK